MQQNTVKCQVPEAQTWEKLSQAEDKGPPHILVGAKKVTHAMVGIAMCIYIYANIHTNTYTNICTNTCTNIYTNLIDYRGGAAEGRPPFVIHIIGVYIGVYICVHIGVCIGACIGVYIGVYIGV